MLAQGIRQCDIPKMRKFLAAGKTPEEVSAGMLGYVVPVETINSFVNPKKNGGSNIAASSHPQDIAAAERRAKAETRKK